jgi:3-oxoadipate enol-lactonase / 4-carboxymuconolactone decarboxylase
VRHYNNRRCKLIDDNNMNYTLQGTPNSPVLIFSNSLGSETMMWDELVPYLLPYFRVLRYSYSGFIIPKNEQTDLQSEYTIDNLAQQVIELMDTLKIETAYFCGLSMGGLVGQWLGINHPQRFKKIALSNTGAKIGTTDTWNDRIKTITKNGMESIVDATMERWFTDNFRKTNPTRVAETRAMFLRSDIASYAACCEAIRDADFREQLHNLSVETLVITGDEDPVTNVAQAEFLVGHIPNATLTVLHARHLAASELPKEFAEILIQFFLAPHPPEGGVFQRGMFVRRTVLGDAHVDKATANINNFNADFQEFITKYAWGEIWTRPNMNKHDRSLITLAMLIALNRPAEFKMHVRAAFNNGVTMDEIKEVIMQSAIYCGLPAANDAFHLAQEVVPSAPEGGTK